jgi:leader peptidase (prepilin peptidase)/N-methyltransferase
VLGSVVAFAVYGAVHLVAPAAMGAGDVKLAASLGAVLAGASWAALAGAAGLAAGLTGGAAVVAASHRPSIGSVPHGPSMLAASWLVTVLAVLQ